MALFIADVHLTYQEIHKKVHALLRRGAFMRRVAPAMVPPPLIRCVAVVWRARAGLWRSLLTSEKCAG